MKHFKWGGGASYKSLDASGIGTWRYIPLILKLRSRWRYQIHVPTAITTKDNACGIQCAGS
jgi:hypothetical protein